MWVMLKKKITWRLNWAAVSSSRERFVEGLLVVSFAITDLVTRLAKLKFWGGTNPWICSQSVGTVSLGEIGCLGGGERDRKGAFFSMRNV